VSQPRDLKTTPAIDRRRSRVEPPSDGGGGDEDEIRGVG